MVITLSYRIYQQQTLKYEALVKLIKEFLNLKTEFVSPMGFYPSRYQKVSLLLISEEHNSITWYL